MALNTKKNMLRMEMDEGPFAVSLSLWQLRMPSVFNCNCSAIRNWDLTKIRMAQMQMPLGAPEAEGAK